MRVLVGEDRCVECSLAASMIFSSPFCEIASDVGISTLPYSIPKLSLEHWRIFGWIA